MFGRRVLLIPNASVISFTTRIWGELKSKYFKLSAKFRSEDQIVQSDFWKPPNFFLFNPLFVLECVING